MLFCNQLAAHCLSLLCVHVARPALHDADISHNLYTQVYGSKRFLLFPPNAWERLYPWPHLHPGMELDTLPSNDCSHMA